jgi:hypothetical protein
MAGAAGCGGDADSCGPGGAPDVGVVATGGGVTMTFGNLVGRVNNDCRTSDAPSGVISVTLTGQQSDGSGQITLCIARPDLLAKQSQPLVADVPGSGGILIVDLDGSAVNCSFSVDQTMPVTGSATSTGLCSNGSDPAGFALSLDGAVALKRTCGTTVDSLSVSLRGRVAVDYSAN